MEIKEDKPENRIDHMTYLPDMEVLESDVQRKVTNAWNNMIMINIPQKM